MHRETQHRGAQLLRHRAGNVLLQAVERLLGVHRLRVIHHGGDALRFELRLHAIALFPAAQPERILCPARIPALRNDRQNRRDTGEGFVVHGRCRVHVRELILFKGVHLHKQDRRLDRVETGVHADADVVVFKRALAVDAEGADHGRRFVGVGEHRTAVAVAAEGLRGEEGRACRVAESAVALAVQHAAEALRRVLQEEQAVLFAHGGDRLMVCGQAEEIDVHHGLRRELSFRNNGFDGRLKTFRVRIERIGADIIEHRRAAHGGDGLARGEEREVRHEHGVAGADAPRHHAQLQRVGAVAASDAVLPPDVGGKTLLKRFHLLAADEMRAGRHGDHGRVHLRLQNLILLLQITKLH